MTIIPRGRALGVTMFLPEEDRLSYSRQFLQSQICSLFGGRVAESLIFGEDAVTTGASNDIERATLLARNMVTKWGLSEKMGPLAYQEDEGEVFLGRSVTKHSTVSSATQSDIDAEVRKIIDRSYNRAKKLLEGNIDKLHVMADALIKYETIESTQIDNIMEGQEPGPPAGWGDDDKGPAAPEAEAPADGPAEGQEADGPLDAAAVDGPTEPA